MKKLLSLFLVLFVILSSALMTCATEWNFAEDRAGVLTDDELIEIYNKCAEISLENEISVLVHVTMSTDGEDIHSYAESHYTTYAPFEDGLIFVINLNNNEVGNRDYYTYYQGTVYDTFGDEAYNSDYGYVNQSILPYLANEDYYTAIQTYLKITESYITGEIYNDYDYSDDYYTGEYWENDYYTDGAIVTSPADSMSPVVKELIVIVVAGVVAFVIMSVMKSKMNTAVVKNEASDYVKAGSMRVTRQLDVFTHRHVTKTAKPKNNSSSGGRSGGISVGGGGRSGGGGGKF